MLGHSYEGQDEFCFGSVGCVWTLDFTWSCLVFLLGDVRISVRIVLHSLAANPSFLLGKTPKSSMVCGKGCFREHLTCCKLFFTGQVIGFDLKDQELANPPLPVTDLF